MIDKEAMVLINMMERWKDMPTLLKGNATKIKPKQRIKSNGEI